MTGAKKIAVLWAPLLAYMALIWHLSSGPVYLFPSLDIPFKDKIAHMAEYSLFGLLAARAFFPEVKGGRRALFAVTILAAAVWGGIDEAHQSFVPSRQADAADFAVDAAGGAAGCAIFLIGTKHGKKT